MMLAQDWTTEVPAIFLFLLPRIVFQLHNYVFFYKTQNNFGFKLIILYLYIYKIYHYLSISVLFLIHFFYFYNLCLFRNKSQSSKFHYEYLWKVNLSNFFLLKNLLGNKYCFANFFKLAFQRILVKKWTFYSKIYHFFAINLESFHYL